MKITIQDFAGMTSGLAAGTTKGGTGPPLYTPAGAPDTLSYESVGISSQKDLNKSMSDAFNAVGKNVKAARKETNNLVFTKFQNDAESFFMEEAQVRQQEFMEASDEDLLFDKSQTLIAGMRDDTLTKFETKYANTLKNPYVAERWVAIKSRYMKAAGDYLSNSYQREIADRVALMEQKSVAEVGVALRELQKVPMTGDAGPSNRQTARAAVFRLFKEQLDGFNIPESRIELLFNKESAKAEVAHLKALILSPGDRKKLPKTFDELQKKYSFAAEHESSDLFGVFQTYQNATLNDVRGLAKISISEKTYSDPQYMLKHKTYKEFQDWANQHNMLSQLGVDSPYAKFSSLTETDYKSLMLEARRFENRLASESKTVPKNIKDRFSQDLELLGTKLLRGEEITGKELAELIEEDKDYKKHRAGLITDTRSKQVQSLLNYQAVLHDTIIKRLKDPKSSLTSLASQLEKLNYQNFASKEYGNASPSGLMKTHAGVTTQIRQEIESFQKDQGLYAENVLQRQELITEDTSPYEKAIAVNAMTEILSGQSSGVYVSKAYLEAVKTEFDSFWKQGDDLILKTTALIEKIENDYKNDDDVPIADGIIHGYVDPETGNFTPGVFPPVAVWAAFSKNEELLNTAAYAMSQGNDLKKKYDIYTSSNDSGYTSKELKEKIIAVGLKEFKTTSFFDLVEHDLEEILMRFQNEGVATPLEYYASVFGNDKLPGLLTGMRHSSGGSSKTAVDAIHRLVMADILKTGSNSQELQTQVVHSTHAKLVSAVEIVPTMSGQHSVLISDADRQTSDLHDQVIKSPVVERASAINQIILNMIASKELSVDEDTVPVNIKWDDLNDQQTKDWKNFFAKNFAMLSEDTTMIPVKSGDGRYDVYVVSKGAIVASFPVAGRDGNTLSFSQQDLDEQTLMTRDWKMADSLGTFLASSMSYGTTKEKQSVSEWMEVGRQSLGGDSLEKKQIFTLTRLGERITKTLASPSDPVTYSEMIGHLQRIAKETEPQQTMSLWAAMKNMVGAEVLKRTPPEEADMMTLNLYNVSLKKNDTRSAPIAEQWKRIAKDLGFDNVSHMVKYHHRKAVAEKDPEAAKLFMELFKNPTKTIGKLKVLPVQFYKYNKKTDKEVLDENTQGSPDAFD